jgi:hypothetical protein
MATTLIAGFGAGRGISFFGGLAAAGGLAAGAAFVSLVIILPPLKGMPSLAISPGAKVKLF